MARLSDGTYDKKGVVTPETSSTQREPTDGDATAKSGPSPTASAANPGFEGVYSAIGELRRVCDPNSKFFPQIKTIEEELVKATKSDHDRAGDPVAAIPAASAEPS